MTTLPFDLTEEWRFPLAFATGVLFYVLTLVVGRILLKRIFVKPRITFHLTALTLTVLTTVLIFYPKVSWLREAWTALIFSGVLFGWVLFDRLFFSLYLERSQKVSVPNILRQMLALVVVLSVVTLVLTYGYQVKVTGLIATSGVAAVILGFAMQDLLSNVIAGFSIHMTKAYKVGDWLLLGELGERAEVKEINWRATRLLNTDSVSFEIPNNEIVKSRITNLNYPNREHRVRMRVGIDYDVPPNDVKEALRVAAIDANGVLDSPAPCVFLVGFGDSSILYELRFWMRAPHLFNQTCDEIRTKIWYELKRRDIRIPFPIRTLEMRTPNTPEKFDQADQTAAELLRCESCLHCLTEEQAESIAQNSTRKLYAKGEKIVNHGDSGSSMFVVLDGRVDVFLPVPEGGSERVATLGKGEYFGEMSLLTGEPRSATIRAASDVFVMEVSKSCVKPLLTKSPELMEELGQLLASRQTQIAEALAARSKRAKHSANAKDASSPEPSSMLKKIRSFFAH